MTFDQSWKSISVSELISVWADRKRNTVQTSRPTLRATNAVPRREGLNKIIRIECGAFGKSPPTLHSPFILPRMMSWSLYALRVLFPFFSSPGKWVESSAEKMNWNLKRMDLFWQTQIWFKTAHSGKLPNYEYHSLSPRRGICPFPKIHNSFLPGEMSSAQEFAGITIGGGKK